MAMDATSIWKVFGGVENLEALMWIVRVVSAAGKALFQPVLLLPGPKDKTLWLRSCCMVPVAEQPPTVLASMTHLPQCCGLEL
eukprot:113004-Pelagomonas_calceolata.AAC.4